MELIDELIRKFGLPSDVSAVKIIVERGSPPLLETHFEQNITTPASIMSVLEVYSPRELCIRGEWGSVDLDTGATYLANGVMAHLTPVEREVMKVLGKNRNHFVTSEQVIDHVWGHHYRDSTTKANLRTLIHRIRRKINDQEGIYLTTAYGGYMLKTSALLIESAVSDPDGLLDSTLRAG